MNKKLFEELLNDMTTQKVVAFRLLDNKCGNFEIIKINDFGVLVKPEEKNGKYIIPFSSIVMVSEYLFSDASHGIII